MNVLVTGGSGFIGSNIVDRLIEEGHKVTVLDLWESDEVKVHFENPNFSFIKGTVLEDDLLETIVVDHNIDRMVHLAAVLGTSGSIQSANVTQFGSKYTDKINVKVFGTATSNIANLRAV